MHVHASTTITPMEVKSRFESIATEPRDMSGSDGMLTYSANREPPKFFLKSSPLTLPAAAEVAINEHPGGANVVLRLMWGPLPAPFPRALAAIGMLLGLLLAVNAGDSTIALGVACVIALFPIAVLLYQKMGEQHLKARLGELLGGADFVAKPH